jgi:hypothetical protein
MNFTGFSPGVGKGCFDHTQLSHLPVISVRETYCKVTPLESFYGRNEAVTWMYINSICVYFNLCARFLMHVEIACFK